MGADKLQIDDLQFIGNGHDQPVVIAFDVEDQNTKGITFICPINEKEVSSILVKIGKTIKLNKERELKERLFKQTVEQLKQTFEKTDLDKKFILK